MAIAKLSIDLEARLANLQAGLDKAGAMAERTANDIRRSFETMRGLTSVISGLGVGLASAFTVPALVTFINRTAQGIDALNDLKDATGASIGNLSALEDIAARTGTNFDSMADALVKMNKALADAKPGSELAEAFAAIGLSVEDLKRLDPVVAFQRIGVALQGFADDGNKARLVQEVFGKSLREVAPLLKDVAEAGALNATVTEKMAEEAEKFNKEVFAMQKNITDVSRALVGPMISALNETIEKFRQGAKEGRSFYRTLFEEQMRIIGLGNMLPSTGGASGSWADDGAKPSLQLPPDQLFMMDQLGLLKGKGARGGGKATAPGVSAIFDRQEAFRAAELANQQAVEEAMRTDRLNTLLNDQAEARRKVADQQKRLADILRNTPTGQLEAAQESVAFIVEQFSAGNIASVEQYAEALNSVTAALAKAEPALEEMSTFANQAARNIQDALGNTLEATLTGHFESIGQLWKNLLVRMASEAAAAQIGKELFGDFGTGGKIGGTVGDLLKWLPSLFAADGAAFGPAGVRAFASGGILGPGGGLLTRPTIFPMANGGIGLGGEAGIEAVMPLKRGRNGKLGVQMEGGRGGVALTYAPQITIDARTDQAQVAQIVSGAVQEGQRQMLQHLKASGVLQ